MPHRLPAPRALRAALLPLAALVAATACVTTPERTFRRDSGGPLDPLQAAYDVREYDLALSVDPARARIAGRLTVRADVLVPLGLLRLDLDPLLTVSSVQEGVRRLAFTHAQGRLDVDLGRRRAPGETLEVEIAYGGTPRVAPNPPWEGGFVWSRTPSGAPWVATACQGEGADLWWPCKDHPSDEPDEMWIRATVPANLVCVSNGRLEGVADHEDGSRTFTWHVTTPINAYGVALNIAPYVALETSYRSTAGDDVPVTFWALPEHEEPARAFLPEILEHLAFYERLLGPYPFRADKYGVVETPHLGMEHQTAIAYGNGFRGGEWGFDWLHHHELAHEWFANLVTAPDWNDFWIHEGFATYMQNLYTEELHGPEAYRESLARIRGRILNRKPLAPREPKSSSQMYFVDPDAPPGERVGDGDIYFKGAWVLHTLRYLVGDEAFFRFLHRVAYPDPALERTTDGSACRFATTDEVMRIAEEESGRPLDWFFELYCRQPFLPRLASRVEGDRLDLWWETPDGMPFPMPLVVRAGGREVRLPMADGRGSLTLPPDGAFELDPDGWILRESPAAGE